MVPIPLVPHQLDRLVDFPNHGRVVVSPAFEEFDWELTWSIGLRVRDQPQVCGYLVFCRLDHESVCNRLLGKSFNDVESELLRLCVAKIFKESCPPAENEPWVLQHHSLFVTDGYNANEPSAYFTCSGT